MILLPVAVGLFCFALVDAWRRRWRNAVFWFQSATILLLAYLLWGQSHLTDYQRAKIQELREQLKKSESK